MAMKSFSQHTVLKLFSAVTVTASGTSASDVIDVSNLRGYFSFQWALSGDGTGKFECYVSNDGSDFLNVVADIASGQTKTSGPGGNGKNMASFAPMPCAQMYILVTETGGADSITVSAWMKAY